MYENIAAKALAIAKKNEVYRINEVKETVIAVVNARFNELLQKCEHWTAISTDGSCNRDNSYAFQSLINYDHRYLQAVATETGFIILPVPHDKEVFISIPKPIDTKPLTLAQKMLADFTDSLNEHRKNVMDEAESVANSIFDRIENSPETCTTEFICADIYKITVPMAQVGNASNELYLNHLEVIIKAHSFYKCNIHTNCIELYVDGSYLTP